MADFLLVHDLGQGSWCWGRVWGHLTAPQEHPPRLYSRGAVGKVVALDLPGHGARAGEDISGFTSDNLVDAVADEVRQRGLRDLIMVGHGITAPILFQAASKLEEPPKRIVVFAGFIPPRGTSPRDALPPMTRMGFRAVARFTRAGKNGLKLPKAFINRFYCNGMDPFDVIQTIGRFTPMPLQLFQVRGNLNDVTHSCPVTYVPLWRDRLLSPAAQMRMAGRLEDVELAREVDSCHQVMIEQPKEVADILLRYV